MAKNTKTAKVSTDAPKTPKARKPRAGKVKDVVEKAEVAADIVAEEVKEEIVELKDEIEALVTRVENEAGIPEKTQEIIFWSVIAVIIVGFVVSVVGW